MVALRKIFANSFGHACRDLLYKNFSRFEAPRARRYFRSCFTLATLVLLILFYNLVFNEGWWHGMSYFTSFDVSTATITTCLLSLFTYTYRHIQKGAMKALDLYRPDDVLLHQINGAGFLGVNIIFSFLFCYLAGVGLAGLWMAQFIQDLFIIAAIYWFYLSESEQKRVKGWGCYWIETYKDSYYNINCKIPPFAIDWDSHAVQLSKKLKKENKDNEYIQFRNLIRQNIRNARYLHQ